MAYGSRDAIQAGGAYVYFRRRQNGAYVGPLREVGYTQGPDTVTFSADTRDLLVNQMGTTPIGRFLTGDHAVVKLNLAEFDFERLVYAIPTCTPYPGFGESQEITEGIGIGRNPGVLIEDIKKGDYDNEVGIYVHPVSEPNASGDYDIVIFIATADPGEALEFPYGPDGEQIFESTFYAKPDTSRENGMLLAFIGPDASGMMFV